MAIDPIAKVAIEKNHEWGDPLSRPAELEQKVSDRLEELGLSDLDHAEPDPVLFGYVLDKLISIQPRS